MYVCMYVLYLYVCVCGLHEVESDKAQQLFVPQGSELVLSDKV
jgi:hypothetical protein